MQDLMIKMAKEAVTNESLIASSIQSHCETKNKTWVDIAQKLNISEAQLAQLALCQQPRPQTFSKDILQIANYTEIEVDHLTKFLQPSSLFGSLKRKLLQKSTPEQNSRGNNPMIKRRAITFVIALIAILFVSAFLFNQPTNANATLNVLTGKAMVTQASSLGGTSNVTVEAGNSIILSTQDRVEMATNSTAELFLFEGSQVDLAENTVLELTELANNDSDHQIYMTLFNGRIVNRVTKLLGVDDAYEVRTPSSTASVRGTVFSVSVLSDNATEVNVTEGIVEVALGNEVAQVHAGEEITAVSNQPLNVQPSITPEVDPTAAPTDEPAEEPTDTPTEEPTDIPTEEPTASISPDETEEDAGDKVKNPGNGSGNNDGIGNDSNNGNGSGNNGNGDGSNGNIDGTGNDGNNGNGSGNNGNGDGSNGNNDGTGNDGNNGNGSGNNGNGDGSNGNNDGTGNDGNNGNGSGNNGNGDGSNGNNGNGNGNGNN